MTDLAATVDNTQFTKSSRNFLKTRLNPSFMFELPIFSRIDCTQVPAKKDFLQLQQMLNGWDSCTSLIAQLRTRRCSARYSEEESKEIRRLHQKHSTHKRQQTEDGQKCWRLRQNTCNRHRNDINLIGSVTRHLKFNQKELLNQQGATLKRS